MRVKIAEESCELTHLSYLNLDDTPSKRIKRTNWKCDLCWAFLVS